MEDNKEKYVSLAEAAQFTNYSQDYLSLLCRQGKLKARKLGRNWVTTKEWVQQYVDSSSSGVNVIPVKIVKNNTKCENKKEAGSSDGIIASVKRVFTSFEGEWCYFQGLMEFLVFALSMMLIFVNLYLFAYHVEMISLAGDERVVVYSYPKNNNYQNNLGGANQVSALVNLSKNQNMTQEELRNQLTTMFGSEALFDIQDGYVLVTFTNDPVKKFLYIIK